MHKDNSEFKPDKGAINSWASQLISENHLSEATELSKLNVQLYPDSSSAYDGLGEAYMKSGQKELAIESYKKSLEKNPDDTNARDKLKQLQGSAAAQKD
jgi:tetratricopeptide (TPR) repeat protein